MNNESLQTIRESSRNFMLKNRRKHRDEATDVQRSLKNIRISPDTVVIIANKLKTKSIINSSELRTLKNALIDGVQNIEVVLNVHGALRGLVRELSGHDVKKQCEAASCLCNLALGDSKSGAAIAKAAGAYLVPALDNLTTELSVTSAWTIGNLAGSGSKACELLSAQGAIAKLIETLKSPTEEIREAVLYALTHFAYQLKDDLRVEDVNTILQFLPNTNLAETSQLLFILSCHKDFTYRSLTEEHLLRIIQSFIVSIETYSNKDLSLIHLIRVLANINSKDVYDVVIDNFLNHNLSDGLKVLLCDLKFRDSLLWLLGNILNCCGYNVFLERVFSN